MICENGHTNQDGLNFCRTCGVSLSSIPTPNAPTDEDIQTVSSEYGVAENDRVVESSSSLEVERTEQLAHDFSEQSSVTNLTIWGIVLSLLLGAIGGIVGIVLGRKALGIIDRSGGGIRGRGGALTSVIIGTAAIIWSIGLVIALVTVANSSAPQITKSATKSTYTLDWADEVYGATCSQVETQFGFDYSLPVRVFGPSGRQVALGIMSSGTDGSAINSHGERVSTCTYFATIRSIPKGLGTYTVSDFGQAESQGLSFSEKSIANDTAGSERGNY